MTYTKDELDNAALADLVCDARVAREQAENGPYYPAKGITKESLLAYAEKCERMAERFRNGGAHKAVLSA